MLDLPLKHPELYFNGKYLLTNEKMQKYTPSANKIRLASIRYLWTLLYTLSPFAFLPFSLFHISTPQSRDPRLVSPSHSVDMTIRGIANSSEAWPFKPDRLFYGLHLQSCIVVRSHPRLPFPTRPPTLAARRHPRKRVFCLVLSHSHGRAIIPLNTRVHARAVCRHRRDAADTRVYTRPRYPISFRSGTETQPPGEERMLSKLAPLGQTVISIPKETQRFSASWIRPTTTDELK